MKFHGNMFSPDKQPLVNWPAEEEGSPPRNVHHTGNPEEASVTRYAKRKPTAARNMKNCRGEKSMSFAMQRCKLFYMADLRPNGKNGANGALNAEYPGCNPTRMRPTLPKLQLLERQQIAV